MDNLEQQLRQLSSLEPTSTFREESKSRLMQSITYGEGAWFSNLLKKIGMVSPRPVFVEAARIRLMSRIMNSFTVTRDFGARFWLVFKSVMVSTLVLALAVTSTLFFVDGKQIASAAEDTYVQVLSGTISVRRADQLAWNDVTVSMDLLPGDLVRVPSDSSAVVRFFDDSELRLAGGSLALINQLKPSPVYSHQGLIEVFLHEGKAWVQTLNVDDGFSGFHLVTRDLAVTSQHASFAVDTRPFGSSSVQVYNYGVQIANGPALHVGEKLLGGSKFLVEEASPDSSDVWVKANQEADAKHLTAIRDRELQNLHASTGVVPGEVLYPVKQIKERIALALTFDPQSANDLKVSIANKRLQEAMVLIDQGKMEEAKKAILAYQSAAAQITEQEKLASAVAVQQKTLVAALPSDSGMGFVKAALDTMQEQAIVAPLEREKVRLQNVQDQILLMQDLVAAGDLESAKEILQQMQQTKEDSVTLTDEATLGLSPEDKKTLAAMVMQSRQAELKLFETISDTLKAGNPEMAALIQSATENAKKDLSVAQSYTVAEFTPVLHPWDAKIAKIHEKMAIYTSWTGQRNQLERVLGEDPVLARNTVFLKRLRDSLDQRAADYVSTKIRFINLKASEIRGNQIQWRIERSKRLRDATEEKIGDPAPSRKRN